MCTCSEVVSLGGGEGGEVMRYGCVETQIGATLKGPVPLGQGETDSQSPSLF